MIKESVLDDTHFQAVDAHRRIANTVRAGTVTAIDYSQARARVSMGGNVTAWVPWQTARAGAGRISWNPPQIGEQVVVVSPSGDPALAFISHSLYSQAQPAPAGATGNQQIEQMPDGTVLSYDWSVHALSVSGPQTVIVTAQNSITVQVGNISLVIDSSGVQITGNLNVQGNITATGTIQGGA